MADILMNKEIKRGQALDNVNRSAAIQFYNNGRYQDALRSYTLVADVNDEDKFWMAMAFFYEKDYMTAENNFKDLYVIEDMKFRTELKWYYALSLLQNGKQKEAQVLFKDMQTWKSKEAKHLLNALKDI